MDIFETTRKDPAEPFVGAAPVNLFQRLRAHVAGDNLPAFKAPTGDRSHARLSSDKPKLSTASYSAETPRRLGCDLRRALTSGNIEPRFPSGRGFSQAPTIVRQY
ncbi:C2H2 and C2HC zinc fingers superfamily protein [Striga asiatica]|uniref:C2H2 and C2HC zinc fingers superfamily protein n=1 Tax=Striga asiatica TaxID=4170 RepID=A0A5A7QGD1_STRAF|nr:C2H2 and C2HC zinc fingers superfamily protein [Striga asiatica]